MNRSGISESPGSSAAIARRLVVALLLVTSLCGADEAEEEAKNLIVVVERTDQISKGAGIVFAASESRLHVVTANHVVRQKMTDEPTAQVTLRQFGEKPLDAMVLVNANKEFDIAVLVVDLRPLGVGVEFALDRLGSSRDLEPEDRVWHIGHPGGEDSKWSRKSDPMKARQGSWIIIETQSVDEGNSGGGLFDTDMELVGMVVRTSSDEAKAVDIETVIAYLREWDLPIHLERSTLPVCKIPRVRGSVPDTAWYVYNSGLREATSGHPNWDRVRELMIKAIERHPAEHAFAQRGHQAGSYEYLPYYYLGLALYHEDAGSGCWNCAWQISFEERVAVQTTVRAPLARYRKECVTGG